MDGLAQSHLVCEDAVEAVVVEGDQPLKSHKLVVFEFSAFEDAGLFFYFFLDGVGQIVVHFVGTVEGGFKSLFGHLPINFLQTHLLLVILGVSFLNEHFGSQFLQKLIGLAQKLFDFVVLFQLDQFEVGFVVMFFECVESFLCLFVLDHIFFFLLDVADGFGLVGKFFPVFLFFAVPLEDLLLVDAEVLHELLVLDFLPPFVIGLDLVFHFLNSVAFVPILLEFFPAEVVAVEELLLEESQRFIIIFKTL